MRSDKTTADLNRSAAGMYLRELERLLGIDVLPPEPGQARPLPLPGGCILYNVPPQQWLRNRRR